MNVRKINIIYVDNIQLWLDRWLKDMNRWFAQEKIQIVNKHLGKCLASLRIKELQIGRAQYTTSYILNNRFKKIKNKINSTLQTQVYTCIASV